MRRHSWERIYQVIKIPLWIQRDLTLKKKFDISANWRTNKKKSSLWIRFIGKNIHGKHLSLIGDETVINLQRAKVYVFSDSVLCIGRILQNPMSNEAWKGSIGWIMTDKSYREYDGISGEPTEFEWNIFPGFTTLQLCDKVNDLLSDLGETPDTFTGSILFMSMFNDISCDKKDNEEECVTNAKVVSILAKKFGIGQWSFFGPGSEKKWYCMEEDSPQGIWDHIAEEMLLEFAESGCPIFRATTPLSRCNLKSKGHGKLSIHFCCESRNYRNCFSHTCFCQSVQSLRSSRKHVWRMWIPSRSIRATLMYWWDNQLFSVKSKQKFL